VPDDDVIFVFNRLRRVRVVRAGAEWLERDWLRTEEMTDAGRRWLGIAVRGGLDKGRDVLLDPHMRDDLSKVLSEVSKQGRLESTGLQDLYAASQEPFTTL
jgi:glucuronate isomerase